MRAIIRGVSDVRTDVQTAAEVAAARDSGATLAAPLSSGTLIDAEEDQLKRLEARGLRVKRLSEAHRLRIGRVTIDIARGRPDRPPRLTVPATLAATWPLHLLHLVAPLEPGWVERLHRVGLDVIEVLSGQGIVVRGSPDAAQRARALEFVDYSGPLEPEWKIAPNLHDLPMLNDPIWILVDGLADIGPTREFVEQHGGRVELIEAARDTGGRHTAMRCRVAASVVSDLAQRPEVQWLERAPRAEPTGERETQIVAENLDATDTQPVPGYQAWLTGLGVNGTGVTVSICDTGVDRNANNNTAGHADLAGRQVAFVDYTNGGDTNDSDGHGTHVAGIAVGSAATGTTEVAAPNSFLWGQGVAPAAQFVTQNYLGAGNTNPATTTLGRDAVTNGATVMNNSWTGTGSAGSGYTTGCAQWDRLVRDADGNAAGLQPLTSVFAAANFGGFPNSLGSPQEAKNPIIVGNSLTFRVGTGFPTDNIEGIAGSSSRGPAGDNRLGPTVVAPGTDVSSAWSRFGNTGKYAPIAGTGTAQPDGTRSNAYLSISGTSMAAPHVTGACAVITEWWRNRTGGKTPSPALLKALLVNSAEDMAGGPVWRDTNRTNAQAAQWTLVNNNIWQRTLNPFTPTAVMRAANALAQVANVTGAGQWSWNANTSTLTVGLNAGDNPSLGNPVIRFQDAAALANIPNNDQGWGRISLENLFFQAPTSDRGPRLYIDQTHAFTAAAQQHRWTVAAADPNRPLRVTLTWTDPPAAAGANPALVNDLDLEVQRIGTATTYHGNHFNNGFSTAGGTADSLNNVECVFIQNPVGSYEIRVVAAALTTDARPPYGVATPWQDFALVIENAVFVAAAPVSVVTALDRSGSMVSSGYVDVTRLAARQFVDLMQVNDKLGVVSFGDSGNVHVSDGSNVQEIAGIAEQATARAAIDGIGFGGCTYMGDGIAKAGGLLANATGRRAIVLLSDGYDNKGCQPNNPARLSAVQAADALPSDIGIYACAMGPLSDQALLQSLSSSTDGRYYYMPTIDDLLEIYNYIRGNVSGDSVSANESASASSSRVGAWVDPWSSQATFVVSFAAPGLVPVQRTPTKPNEISVRLRDPRGRLLPANASWVRRIVGDGYVMLRVDEPLAGLWYMEVETRREPHTRYQAACFLRSSLRLRTHVGPASVIRAGTPLLVQAALSVGKDILSNAQVKIRVTRPRISLAEIQRKHGDALHAIRLEQIADALPDAVRRIDALRSNLLAAGQGEILTAATEARSLSFVRGTQAARVLDPRGTYRAQVPTATVGSYNVLVDVSGVDAQSGGRYRRKDLISLRVE